MSDGWMNPVPITVPPIPQFLNGTGTFINGVATVANISVKATSIIMIQFLTTIGAAIGVGKITAITPGVSFQVTSTLLTNAVAILDQSVFTWLMLV